MGQENPPFLRRVVLRNYKSIRECDVTLGPLTFLVGPNGSGKSNFLDALRFVSDSLRTTMQQAVEERGEVRKLFWRGGERDCRDFSIELDLNLPDGREARYGVTVGDAELRFVIDEEHCSVMSQGKCEAEFLVQKGQVAKPETTIPTPPPASRRDLYLTKISGYAEFATVYELLSGMRFFNIDPQRIREEASSGKPAHGLMRGGEGALYVTQQVFRQQQVWQRMHEYLRAILPTLRKFDVQTDIYVVGTTGGAGSAGLFSGDPDCLSGEPRSLKFVLSTDSAPYPSLPPSHGLRVFDAGSMSDGTLRAFGVLLALFQCADRPEDDPIPLVGIEEPEATLHPAAAGVLFDALHEASHFTQVLVTTHSPDLLDIKDVDADSLLIVDMVDGQSVIGPADEVSRSIMRDRLATAGELLRQNQLRPESQSPGAVGAEAD
jgi:energy-coupling factor transporter ATP-binding protein EcfA2